MTKSNTLNKFRTPIVGLCVLLCMTLWVSVAQAQQMSTFLIQANVLLNDSHAAGYTQSPQVVITENVISGLGGDVLDPGVYVGSTVGVVDWIEVQIRVVAGGEPNAPTVPANAVNSYRKVAWLLSDGSVVDAGSDIAAINSGTPGELTIPTDADGLTFVDGQDLYVLLDHRNHLPIMSAGAVQQNESVYVHDFRNAENQSFGGTVKAATTGALSGKFVMFAGDSSANNDGVDAADGALARRGFAVGGQLNQSGYLESDYSLNGTINAADTALAGTISSGGNLTVTSPITY